MFGAARKVTQKRIALIMALLVVVWSLVYSSGAIVQAASDDNTDSYSPGAVYSITNAVNGNAVAVYDRADNGKLSLNAYFFTGGKGTGAGLGSQGAVVLEKDWVFAVNAGSNSISALKVESYGLRLTDTVSSGGTLPTSLTAHDGLVYVLNAGGVGSISGFRLNGNGKLVPIANSTRPLSGSGVNPAEIAFSPNGRLLAVTEKGTNKIDTYQVGENGRANGPKTFASAGATPFGFSWNNNRELFVSEAFGGALGASAASLYKVSDKGDLTVVSASVKTNQTAACWVAISKDGKYAYTANPTSDSLTGYQISQVGLTLLNADGRTGTTTTGSAPEDAGFSKDGHFLYVLDVKVGKVSSFKLEANGQLSPLGDFEGLPTSSVGLAVR
jgi:6-phosphogluconolactonase (cycloisomerase 2 family)